MANPSGLKFRVSADADIPTPAAGKVHVYFTLAGAKYKDETGTAIFFPSVASFNGRVGAIAPVQADYDGFFLTPAEGNAAYDALGAASAAAAASQPLDPQLTALAGLAPGADKIPYFTALTTAALADFTSVARNFCAAVDAAAQRSVLGLGTAAVQNTGFFDASGLAAAAQAASQPLDSDLTAIAALTTTSFGRSFLALADAAAARTLISVYSQAQSDAQYQPIDSDLTAISALTTTSFGRSFLALADAAAARTLISVYSQAQSDAQYQPLDADLTAIAALATTSFGRSFLPLADAAAGRTLLGLGTAATQNSTAFDASGLAAAAQAAAQAASQPLDTDLTSIAALTTTSFGRGQLTYVDAAAATAALNIATASLKGLMSTVHFKKVEGIWKDIVADFGADPTGGVDATSIIQTAVDSFGAGGGCLYFPAGTFLISGTITVTKPVIIIGAGRSISVISTNHATLTMFVASTGSQGMGFEQMRLASTSEPLRTGGHAFDMGAISNVYMQQCDILFQFSSVHSGGALQFLDDLNIREFGDNADNGQAILVDGFGDRYVRRITTDGAPGDRTGVAGIRVRECSSLVISDCNIINAGNALDVVPNAGIGHQVASILAMNTFFDSSTIGVNIIPATANDTAQRFRFTNCWFGSNTTANFRIGNGTIPNANIASIDIIGCDFFSAGGTPVPFGLDVQGATDWSVRASRFGGHTTNAIRVGVGAGSADHRFSITDNLIGNCLGGGANAQGITIGAGTFGNIQIIDNRGFETNTTPGLVINGTVGATGQINVANNMGCLAGPLSALASGGGSLLASAGRGAVTSGAAETFLATFRIPANSVQVGDILQLTAILQSSSTGTLAPRIRCGAGGTIADVLVNVTGTSAAGTANSFITLNAYIYIIALGPTGTVYAAIQGTSTAAAFNNAVAAEAPGNVVTTGAWFITFSALASVGTYTVRSIRMRLV